MTGQTISHYQIGRKLGEGGMGMVYAAHDQSLNRTVALKILCAGPEHGSESRRRLLREARTAAALNHPNICTIHEVVEENGQAVLVMEYVEGCTLRDRVTERPLALHKALDIALQIASALNTAHDRGIVHRDMKTGNIMLTASDQVKVLDFGLAQWLEQETLSATNICAGTPNYMSPEQARGEFTDHRTDIWALGVIVFEMITGTLPFQSDTTQGVYQRILNEEPEPLTALRTGIPIELDRIVVKALAKDPKERYQHVDDLAVDVQAVLKQLSTEKEKRRSSSAPALAVAPPVPLWRKAAPWALAGVMALAAGTSAWVAFERWGGGKKTMRFISRLPEGQTFAGVDFFSSAISITRDGESIVYVAREGKKAQLWRRKIGEEQAHEISGTSGGQAPFISPDKKWVGYVDGRSLKRIGFQGGSAQTLDERPAEAIFMADIAFFGASWSPEGDPIVVSECTRGLRRFRLMAKAKEVVTDVLSKEVLRQHQFPQVLPGGRYILYTTWNDESDSRIEVLDQETGEQRKILAPGTYAKYVPSGHLVYGWQNNLYAAPFDLKQLKVTGPSVLAVGGVMMNLVRGSVQYDVSDEGTLVYIPGAAVRTFRRLVWVDRTGRVEPVEEIPEMSPGAVRLSATGASLLTMRRSQETGMPSVQVFDLSRRVWRPISAERAGNYWPVWGPDGQSAFFNGKSGKDEMRYSVRRKSVSGENVEQIVKAHPGGHQQPVSVSPDGKYLLFQQWSDNESKCTLQYVELTGGGEPRRFSGAAPRELHGEFSPNGKWVAYAAPQDGKMQVRLRSFPDGREVYQVSDTGGWEPVWSKDGKTIYYRSTDGRRVFAAEIKEDSTLKVGAPKLLFEGDFQRATVWGRTYDVAADGSKFMMWAQDAKATAEPREYHVILNWGAELRRIALAAD